MHTLLALSGWGQTHPLDQNCLDNSGFPSGADRRTNFRVRGRSPSDGQSRQLPSQGQEGSRATTKSTSGNASIMPKQHVQTPLAELANRRKKRVEYDQDRNKTSLRKEDRHIRIREERQKAKELGLLRKLFASVEIRWPNCAEKHRTSQGRWAAKRREMNKEDSPVLGSTGIHLPRSPAIRYNRSKT